MLYFAPCITFVIVAVQTISVSELVVIRKRCVLNDGKTPRGWNINVACLATAPHTAIKKIEITLARAKYKY